MKEQFAQIIFDGSPQKSWEYVAKLEANDGHIFRVFIRAPLKKDLDAFLKQLKRGEIGIRVEVLPEIYEGDRLPLVESALPDEFESTFTTGGVSIGISRLEMNKEKLPEHYRIRYTIDPPISQNDTFSATFSDQSEANIRCDVSLGRVNVVVYQLSIHNTRIDNPIPIAATPNHPATINRPRTHNWAWEVVVTGAGASNYFSLSYDKVVL